MSTARLGLLAAVALLLAILSLQGAVDSLVRARQRAMVPGSAAAPDGGEPHPGAAGAAVCAPVSACELEVGVLTVQGVPTREIAQRLFSSENAVKTHLRQVCRKTGSANRADLLRRLLADAGRQGASAPAKAGDAT